MQDDGSIVVWDLYESSALNESYQDSDGNGFQLRQPAYNTGTLLRHSVFAEVKMILCSQQKSITDVLHNFSKCYGFAAALQKDYGFGFLCPHPIG